MIVIKYNSIANVYILFRRIFFLLVNIDWYYAIE